MTLSKICISRRWWKMALCCGEDGESDTWTGMNGNNLNSCPDSGGIMTDRRAKAAGCYRTGFCVGHSQHSCPQFPGWKEWSSQSHLTGQGFLRKILIRVKLISDTIHPGVIRWLTLVHFLIIPRDHDVPLLWPSAKREIFISQKYWTRHCELSDINPGLQLACAELTLGFLTWTLLNNMINQKQCLCLSEK